MNSINGTSSSTKSDVASILARRVAVEMSDSDAGQSDSEYDSDEWGDESQAWQRELLESKGVSNVNKYFFKSQESLATVIDIDEEVETVEEDVKEENSKSEEKDKDKDEKEEGKKKAEDDKVKTDDNKEKSKSEEKKNKKWIQCVETVTLKSNITAKI